MAARALARWPFEPLRRLMWARSGLPAHDVHGCQCAARGPGFCFSAATVADELGVTTRTVQRWQNVGLSDTAADRAAVTLGLTPHLVWGPVGVLEVAA